MKRVCICGGRNFNDKEFSFEILDNLKDRNIIVVSGGATGADALGEQWAKLRDKQIEVFRADWKNNGRAAGPIRNQKMLDSGIDLLVAFPGGSGTAHMVRICKEAGVLVWQPKY